MNFNWITFFTLIIAVITALFVWWQVSKLNKQIQLQALLDLDKEWNSKTMLDCRAEVCGIIKDKKDLTDEDLSVIEELLEYLEKVCSLVQLGILDKESVWHVTGWYIERYYYSLKERDIITNLRRKWTTEPDCNLYADIEEIYKRLIKMEEKEMKTTKESIEAERS